MSTEFLSFKLSDDFVDQYENRQIDWGFPIHDGLSLGELTYISKYSRIKEDGTKERWHETCRRVIEGMFSIQKDWCKAQRTPWNDHKAQRAAKDAYERMFEFKWTPPGRGMWAMGTYMVHGLQNSAALYNPLHVDTDVLTRDGWKRLGDLAGQTVEILTSTHLYGRDEGDGGTSKWAKAEVSEVQEQPSVEITYRTTMGEEKTIIASRNHRWFRRGAQHHNWKRVTSEELRKGDFLPTVRPRKNFLPSVAGMQHGFFFGDGTRSTGELYQFGASVATLAHLFGHFVKYADRGALVGQCPLAWGEIPQDAYAEDQRYMYGFLAGYFAADGCVGQKGECSISSARLMELNDVRKIFLNLGIECSEPRLSSTSSNFAEERELWTMRINRFDLTEEFFLQAHHRERWLGTTYGKERTKKHARVLSVKDAGVQPVLCATVPEYEQFVTQDFVLTSNCAFLTTAKLSSHSKYEAVWPFSRLMEMSMWGIGCIAEGAWVTTLEGPRRIEDIASETAVVVGSKKHAAPLGAWFTGVKEVVKIVTSEGFELTCTPDHRIRTVSYSRTANNRLVEEFDWVEAQDLEAGDKVAINGTTHDWVGAGGSADEGYLVGAVLGDGWKESNTWVAAAYDKDAASEGIKIRCEASLNPTMRRSNAGGWRRKNPSCEILSVGTWVDQYLTFTPKSMTDAIESASSEFYRGFLRGLFDADGGVTDGGRHGATVRLAQSNRDTMVRVQRMLLRLGIKSSISVKRSESVESTILGRETISNPSWTLTISRDAVAMFSSVVGFSGGHKADLLERVCEERGFYSSRMDATVASVSSAGKVATYDMMVPETEEFDADGIRVHNCGFDTNGAGNITLHDPEGEAETWIVGDTREAWAESVGRLLVSFFLPNQKPVEFDYSEIRPAGSPLKTFGGRASGPGPLIELHETVADLLSGRDGDQLTSRDIVDIMNLIGKAVVAGGARRSAELSLGEIDDEDYINLKNWELEENKRRTGNDGWAWMSNNSVFVNVDTDLSNIIDAIKVNGEPGIVWYDTMREYGRIADPKDFKDMKAAGVNPCVTADTWVMTDLGPRTVEDLRDNPFTAIVDGKPYRSETGFWSTGKKAVKRIEFTDGRSLRLTGNHQLLRSDGEWVEVDNLEIGDSIKVHRHQGLGWDGPGSSTDGYLIGHLIGDGTFGDGVAYLAVWGEDAGSDVVAASIERDVRELGVGPAFRGWFDTSNQRRMGTRSLTSLAEKYGVVRGNKTITEEIQRSSSDMTAGVLAGLFDTDGSVQGHQGKGVSVRLTSIDRDMLIAAQAMLARLGINSTVYTRRGEHEVELPDGRGGRRLYTCKPQWELVVARENLQVFADRIPLRNPVKKAALQSRLDAYERPLYSDRFESTIVAIDDDGHEETFDATVDKVHAFDANGLWAHNCAEITLEGGGELCCLAETYINNHDDLDDYLATCKVAMLYAKTVTLLPTPWPETNEIMVRNRRIGVSMTGTAQFADAQGWDVLRTWQDTGFQYIIDKDVQYSEWLGVRTSIRHTTSKPAGSTSLLAGCAPGVHWPTSAGIFLRRMRFSAMDPIVDVIKAAGYPVEPDQGDPKSTVVAEFPVDGLDMRSEREVSVWEKAELAAFTSRWWADNAVSVTVTFKPEEADQIAPILRSKAGQFKTISFLPLTDEGVTYAQAPFEALSEEGAADRRKKLKKVDMGSIYDDGKAADAAAEKYCTNDHCELPQVS